ncbi:MurR/RpiR family transcriptional regulator [Cetobacterium sp. SF1]|uniref:MurR/RpiR family transcriptional regulator n=1 Tax=unclassified Cetobacterium TaxID=2630983 RepID=UPI003CECB9BF
MGNVLLKISEIREQFTDREIKISQYIEKNLEEVKLLNTYELGKKCGVSQASIVRFSKKLGFSGFPEFKIALSSDIGKQEVENNINIIHEEIKADDSTEDTSKKVAYENIKTIEDTLKLLDFEALDEAVKELDRARKIFILGGGFSGIAARDFYYKLLEIGKMAIFESDSHIQFSNFSTIEKDDVVFVVSLSGKSLDIYNLLKEPKRRGVKIITLTKFSPNPVSDLGDVKLAIASEKNNFRSTALSSRIAQLTVIDMIYVKLIQRNKTLAEKYIGNALEMVKDMKIK